MKPHRPLPSDARRSLFCYNLAFPLLVVFMLPNLLLRMVRRGNYRRKIGQRFARYDKETATRLARGCRVWVQSISVGETMIALRLLRVMQAKDPSLTAVLSVTTSTGLDVAEAAALPNVEVIYTPIDLPWFVRRALDLIRPAQLIVIEGMWANLTAGAFRRGIKTILLARMSPRSERRYRKLRRFTGPAWRLFQRILVWEPADIDRWLALGADPASLICTGAIKFDSEENGHPSRERAIRAELKAMQLPDNALILLGGSTFPGEEALLGEIIRDLRKEGLPAYLLAVPRHAERAPEARIDLQRIGLHPLMLTEVRAQAGSTIQDSLIINTTGELRDWYRVADVVFIGKSMSPAAVGGQNLAEPVAAGKPVVCGPHMENFRSLVEMLSSVRGIFQVPDAAALRTVISTMLRNPEERAAMATRAHTALESHHGATERTATAILTFEKSS